ncbi:hypothetical protein D3C73_1061840 [compost metagenome]
MPGSEPTPPAASQPPAGQVDLTSLATAFTDGLREMSQSFSQALAQASQDTNARFAKLESEHAALKSDIEGTPERSYSARPTHAGGDGAQLTDC